MVKSFNVNWVSSGPYNNAQLSLNWSPISLYYSTMFFFAIHLSLIVLLYSSYRALSVGSNIRVSMSGNHTLAPIALHVKYQCVGVISVLMFALAARPLKNAKFCTSRTFSALRYIYKVFDLTGV